MPQQLSTNTFTSSTWIVNSNAALGTHTTLAAALTSATSGDTILLQTSVTENPTLKAGVNIVGYAGADLTPSVSITGKCTFTAAGTVTIQNIRLITNSDYLLEITGSAASVVNLRDCYLNCSNNTGIHYTSSSGSSAINVYDSSINLGTTGIGIYTMSSAGALSFSYCGFGNSGSSTTASSNSAGAVSFYWSSPASPISTSSGGLVGLLYCNFDLGSTNTTPVTLAGTGGSTVRYCHFGGGSASALSIGAGTLLTANNLTIYSTNTDAITGAGTFKYAGITFLPGSTTLINTTTQVGGTIQGGVDQAPSAGFLGERIESVVSAASVSYSSGSPKNLTSISLTAGIWDCYGQIQYSGSAGSTSYTWASIGTSTGALGTTGNNSFQGNQASSGSNDGVASVLGYRITLTSTTTVYLVGQCNITSGSVSAGGRLSATRVG